MGREVPKWRESFSDASLRPLRSWQFGQRLIRSEGLGLGGSAETHGDLCGSAEARGREGVGIVLLDVGRHLLADEAAEIEVVAGVPRTHKAAEFHGAVAEVGDLQTADLFVPERR